MSGLTYKDAGVDISTADAAKEEMARALETKNARVLNKVGAFASLVGGSFPELKDPVLVLKTEEPGSKQKLAFAHQRYTSICYDLVNHLVNDIVVMGATPLVAQDCIVCGKLEKEVVTEVVRGIARACEEQGCALTGGETSEQPGVLPAGTYILSASIIGVVERNQIIDGAAIREGDVVLAVASNGLHTNGYSLVRKLLETKPALAERQIENETFLDAILKPHLCYFSALQGLFGRGLLRGLAHITGGGIAGNLDRVLPPGVAAAIDLGALQILSIFKAIRAEGALNDAVMLETFNLGVGLAVVVSEKDCPPVQRHFTEHGLSCYPIGAIVSGAQKVTYSGNLRW